MMDDQFTPELVHTINHQPNTLEGLKYLVDILATFAYHNDALTTQDLSNMFAIISMLSGKLYLMQHQDDNHQTGAMTQ